MEVFEEEEELQEELQEEQEREEQEEQIQNSYLSRTLLQSETKLFDKRERDRKKNKTMAHEPSVGKVDKGVDKGVDIGYGGGDEERRENPVIRYYRLLVSEFFSLIYLLFLVLPIFFFNFLTSHF